MPILTHAPWTIDCIDEGEGPAVLLLHSSASGARQWQALIALLRGRRRVIAPNLFGYGETSPWPGPQAQTVADQAALALAALDGVDGPIDLVGHSFGALIALETARALGPRAGRVVAFEPNPFALLDGGGTRADYAEACALHAHIKACGARGDWDAAAARFADFFSGDGTWAATPPARRDALAASLRPNLHEWDAVMDPALRADRWDALTAPVLVMHARDTNPPLRAIARLLLARRPDWQGAEIPRGGHMAPLTRPRAFNAEAARFLGLG